jgi:hypothetical protein
MKSRMYGPLAARIALAGALAAALAGCKTSTPAQPSTAASGAGVSIIAPVPASPTAGAAVAFNSLPVTLSTKNAIATNGTPLTYTFEVAYDAAFASKILTKEAVAQGSNGFTTVVADSLLANNTYYWHVRAQGGGTTGVFSTASQFHVGGPVTLGAVNMVSPANGDFVAGTPTLKVTNVTKTGASAGPVTYKFEVATQTSFAASTIAASGTVSEGAGGQTSYVVSPSLPAGVTYFWRVTASDVLNGVSVASPVHNFSVIVSIASLLAAEEGQVLWPGTQPPGQPGALGHNIYGDNWDVGEKIYVNGTHYLSPEVESLRIMDLMDRGLLPGDAINWMKANGYPTIALYYPDLEVIGVTYQYFAGLDTSGSGRKSHTGIWNLVDRAE